MSVEYPINSEFWKWWNEYWAKQDSAANKKLDISLDFCYNNYIKERKKENPKNGTAEFHEYPPRLEGPSRG